MDEATLRRLLAGVRAGDTSVDQAVRRMKGAPFEEKLASADGESPEAKTERKKLNRVFRRHTSFQRPHPGAPRRTVAGGGF